MESLGGLRRLLGVGAGLRCLGVDMRIVGRCPRNSCGDLRLEIVQCGVASPNDFEILCLKGMNFRLL